MVNFCKSSKCLNGKTAIITGANTGIGYETAKEFAKRGARVILACRTPAKGEAARDQIIKETGNANVVFRLLNLELLESTRVFAKEILNTEARLDLLVNNAGAMNMPHAVTSEGFQVEMVTNYFSHFLLTNLLLDLLKKSAPSRVINVSSLLASMAKSIDVDALNEYDGDISVYAKSKLCNIYFTQELARRLKGTGVTTYSLHPGIVKTDLQRYSSLTQIAARFFFINPWEGAQTTLTVALEDVEDDNGQHFHDCKPVKPYCKARDPEKAKELWEATEKLVGMRN